MITTAAGPVVVEIEGIVEPARFNRLPDAVEALWACLRALPLGWSQFETYRDFFAAGAVERIADVLDRDGKLELSFTMAGRSHKARISLAETKSGSHQ